MTLSMIRKYKIVNPLTMIILEARKIAYYNIRYFAHHKKNSINISRYIYKNFLFIKCRLSLISFFFIFTSS